MAFSNSWNYLPTAANVITAALENIGVLEAGGTVASADSTMCLARLQLISKMLSAPSDGSPGLKVYNRQRVTLLLQKGQQTYTIGPASTDARASTALGRTTISADEAVNQTTLSVTSNTDTTTYPGTTITMTASDIVAIELNN